MKIRGVVRMAGVLAVAVVAGAGLAGAGEPAAVTLGEVLVVGAESADRSGVTTVVSADDAERAGRRTVGEAAALAPGVTLMRVGARNELMVMVRGFEPRQVPLFIDGVPVYVPYDGNVDMGRLDVWDMGSLAISKGYSPVVFGANTLGGAVNVVSARPSQPEEVVARALTMLC